MLKVSFFLNLVHYSTIKYILLVAIIIQVDVHNLKFAWIKLKKPNIFSFSGFTQVVLGAIHNRGVSTSICRAIKKHIRGAICFFSADNARNFFHAVSSPRINDPSLYVRLLHSIIHTLHLQPSAGHVTRLISPSY